MFLIWLYLRAISLKMLCLSLEIFLLFIYLDDRACFAGILCPPGWRYYKTLNSQLCVIPIFLKLFSYSIPSHPPTFKGYWINVKWLNMNAIFIFYYFSWNILRVYTPKDVKAFQKQKNICSICIYKGIRYNNYLDVAPYFHVL